jgi:hypothetical protein
MAIDGETGESGGIVTLDAARVTGPSVRASMA